MPNRMIRETALTSVTLDTLSPGAERLFWRLLLVADDYGRFDADPRVLLAKCLPLKVTRIKLDHVIGWWKELVKADTVRPYRSGDRLLGYFPSWHKHQRTRADSSRFPPPPASDNICPQLTTDSAVVVVEDVVVVERTTVSGTSPTLHGQEGTNGAGSDLKDHARALLAFLNDRAGRQFRPSPTNLGFILGRLKSGASVEDCRSIIARKTREWGPDPKMSKYLRPETLFNATKFESYLGELGS